MTFKMEITLAEAAAMLKLTPRALRAAIKRGTFRAAKYAGCWFTLPANVELYRRDHLRRYGRKAKQPT